MPDDRYGYELILFFIRLGEETGGLRSYLLFNGLEVLMGCNLQL